MHGDGFSQFAEAFEAGRPQILFRRVVADLETPIGAYLKLAEGRSNTFLLESVQGGATRGRYSMIGLDPDVILKVEKGRASINRRAALDSEAFTPVEQPPLEALRALVALARAAPERARNGSSFTWCFESFLVWWTRMTPQSVLT